MMAHKHSVYDTDLHFKIDPITRAVTNQAKDKRNIIQHDHNSERFTFEIPRYVDGHDMSLCNVVQVHYLNIESAKKDNKHAGVYAVDDLQISAGGDDVVIFSWLVSGNATKYVGSLNFVIRFCCVSDDGDLEYVWNTAVFSGISVSTGICNTDVVGEECSDILAAWENRILALEQGGSIALDTTLTQDGMAADAGAVGEYFVQAMMGISGELAKKQPKGNYVQTVNGQAPDEDGNVTVEGGVTENFVKDYVEQYISEALGGDY